MDSDRPATEIEVTPQMVSAGVSALIAFEPLFESEAEGARRIFVAMARAHRRGEPASGMRETDGLP